jgi:hypothetical protein
MEGIRLTGEAELIGLIDDLRMMHRFKPFMKLSGELGALATGSFSARFKDPLLRDGIQNAIFGASESLFPLIMTLGR